MMTLLVVVLVMVGGFLGTAEAQMFQTVPAAEAHLFQDGPGKLYCPGCGMNLVKFYKTSHALEQADGTIHQYCSLHCLVEANAGALTGAQVVDTTTLAFIKADGAVYVVGSDKPGTMTMTSKYAFGTRPAAEEFAAANGGQVMTFDEAVAIARQGLAMENVNIDKKCGKMAEKGRTIFEKMCPGGDIPEFNSIAQAKTYLVETDVCGPLKDGQYQAVAIYLMRRDTMEQPTTAKIQVPAKAKCPVCGMFVAKYPKWAAVVETTAGQSYYFDGVKDMMKFIFKPGDYHVALEMADLKRIAVTDYYTLGAVDARRAFYVTGSNVYGPMGHELVPFATEKDARVFLEDHKGDTILSYDEITEQLVHDLDQ